MLESVRIGFKGEAQALVVGVFSDKKLDAKTAALDADGSIRRAAGRSEFSGDAGKIAEAYPTGKGMSERVLLVGLGKRDGFSTDSLRSIGAAVARRLSATKTQRARIELALALSSGRRVDLAAAGRGFGEALGLLAWNNERFKGKGFGERPKRTALA
jgi:leucyl aminopeptidase